MYSNAAAAVSLVEACGSTERFDSSNRFFLQDLQTAIIAVI
jgi:hypothetical protein